MNAEHRAPAAPLGEVPGRKEPPKLSEALGSATSKQHRELEQTRFGGRWSEGKVTRGEYVMYLADLYRIYSSLETRLESLKDLGCIAPICIEGLYRKEALEKDMEFFKVPRAAVGKAASDYGRRLSEIAEKAPHKLIAHAWVRFMGDLFGGQIIKKKIDLLWPGGTAFYQYEKLCKGQKISIPSKFVAPFRKILDNLPLTDAERNDVIEEAVWAFGQHLKIFEELSSPSYSRFIFSSVFPRLLMLVPKRLGAFVPVSLNVWRE